MPKYGARADANQKKVVTDLRRVPGITVYHTHGVGRGFPDIVVGYRGENYLFEIKDPDQPPSKRKLTGPEEAFFVFWKGQRDIITSAEDAIEVITNETNRRRR